MMCMIPMSSTWKQNMMTEFIETGSLAAYARLCKLRMGQDAQKEVRDVASQIYILLLREFPVSFYTLTSSLVE